MKSAMLFLMALWFVAGNLNAGESKGGATQLTFKGRPSYEVTGRLEKVAEGKNTIVFKTEAGVVYHLYRNERSEALFADPALLSKTLILKGRVDPKTDLFEVTGNLHSLRDGKRYELYYYCDTCSIKSSEPGLCMCCREDVKLVEKPE